MENDRSRKRAEIVPGTSGMRGQWSPRRNRGPARDYGIARYLRRTTNDAFQVEESSLYSALQRPALSGRGNSVGKESLSPVLQTGACGQETAPAGGRGLRPNVRGNPIGASAGGR
jgi:hypothetical protein